MFTRRQIVKGLGAAALVAGTPASANVIFRMGAPGLRPPKDAAAPGSLQLAASASATHVAIAKANGSCIALGDNAYGQGDIESWTGITQIAVGRQHTVGLRNDGTVVATGHNGYGQCNVDTWTGIKRIACGWWHTIGLKEDGTVVIADRYSPASTWTGIRAVAGGRDFIVGMTDTGGIVGAGVNDQGQLNLSLWGNAVTAIAAGSNFTLGLIGAGESIYGTSAANNGANNYRLLAYPCKAIAAGEYHSLALRTDGVLIAKGVNNVGQTSVGGMTGVKRAWAAARGSFVQLNDDRILAAGENSHGQLGDGTTVDRASPVEAAHLMELLAS